MDSLSSDENRILDEQAQKLFQICDTNEKGFIVRADLPKLDGLIPNVSFAHLNEFFNAADNTRTSMVTRANFIRGIKPLLLGTNISLKRMDLAVRAPPLRDISAEQFRTISLDSDNPFGDPLDRRSKLSISIGGPIRHGTDSRGLITSEIITPSPSSGSLITSTHVSVLEKEDTASFDERTKSEFAQILQRSAYSHSDITQFGEKKSDLNQFRPPSPICFEKSLADVSSGCAFVRVAAPARLQLLMHSAIASKELKPQERVYKVVFVGDSAVGKTCFLHRFCNNRFKPLFNATIGVDFTVKNIRVNEKIITVQLWDTAGQERFRSITKQYFRKADAVILLYDVTSEQSFLNVRNWIESVRFGVDDSCVMCLVANKVDLCKNEETRAIKSKNGKELAEEFDMVYFETSAFNGIGINECMEAVASRLLKRDEETIEEALKLDINKNYTRKSSWCCV